jgi:hypothetical protein
LSQFSHFDVQFIRPFGAARRFFVSFCRCKILDFSRFPNEQAKIPYLLGELDASGYGLKILAPELLGHPYLLTWCYQKVFRDHLNADKSPSRFMYIEGDIIITPENI